MKDARERVWELPMGKPIQSLWPGEFGRLSVETPVVILREQAYFLGQQTRNVLEGEVRTEPHPHDTSQMIHKFLIYAPGLNGYTYPLFSVIHAVSEPYPAQFSASIIDVGAAASNEAEFRAGLKRLFAAEKTRAIIESLLAQSLAMSGRFEAAEATVVA